MAPAPHDQPSSDSNTPTESHNIGAPAFLDLADSVRVVHILNSLGVLTSQFT